MKIYLISGFLGAGKTTFIQELFQENKLKKIAVIENDFGDVSIDANILRGENVYVTEISNGCICCTLKGDFVKAIHEIENKYNPDLLLIEPSGVSKLSEMLEMILPLKSQKEVIAVTIIDVERAEMYYHNFGDFYEDQIAYADYLYLNRKTDANQLTQVHAILQNINPDAEIIEEANKMFLLNKIVDKSEWENIVSDHHHATDSFETFTYNLNCNFSQNEINYLELKLADVDFEGILRIKGVILIENKPTLLQYVPGELSLQPMNTTEQTSLTFIGEKLSKDKIEKILLKDAF